MNDIDQGDGWDDRTTSHYSSAHSAQQVAPDGGALVKAIMETHLPGGPLRPSDAGILAITLIESGVLGRVQP